MYALYFTSGNDFDKMLELWNKITPEQKVNHLINMISMENLDEMNYWRNFKCYSKFKNDVKLSDDQEMQYNECLIKYYGRMLLKPETQNIGVNLTHQYCTEIVYECIKHYFDKFDDTEKYKYYETLVTSSPIPITDAIEIVSKLNYDIENRQKLFDKVITELNQYFNRYYQIMMYINKKNYDFTEIFDCPYITYTNYMDHIKELYNDPEYVLLNKLQICNCLINISNTPDCHFYKLTRLDKMVKSISYERLARNDNYVINISAIWSKIYSNIIMEYNHDNYNNFVPISVLELVYK
jgi:hypothetical protein